MVFGLAILLFSLFGSDADLDQLVNLFAQRDDLREVHVAIEFEKLFKWFCCKWSLS
jgi:hypothetical protein